MPGDEISEVEVLEQEEAPEPEESGDTTEEVEVPEPEEIEEISVAIESADPPAFEPAETLAANEDITIEISENLDESFKNTMEAVAPSAPPSLVDDGEGRAGSGEPEPVSDKEVGAVQEVAQVSAVPEVSLAGSSEAGSMTIGEPVVEDSPGPEAGGTAREPSLEQTQAEQTTDASGARTEESQTLPEDLVVDQEADEPKLIITDPDGDDGKLDLDDGMKQAGDFREDTKISDQYKNMVDERGGAEGYLGGDKGGELIPDKELGLGMDGMLDGSGRDMVDAGLPGPDQLGELGDLKDAAGFGGGDGRLSTKDADDDSTTTSSDKSNSDSSSSDKTGTSGDSSSSSTSGDKSSSDSSSSSKSGTSTGTGTRTTSGKDSTGTTRTDGKTGDSTSSDKSGTSTGGGGRSRGSDTTGKGTTDSGRTVYAPGRSGKDQTGGTFDGKKGDVSGTSPKSYDPEGTDGSAGDMPGGPVSDPMDQPLNLTESMSQPVDEDGASRQEPGIAFDRASQSDPYAQYTGEETGGFGVIPEGELDPDGILVDPPGFAGGGVLLSTMQNLESNLAVSDTGKNQQAAAVLGEQMLAGKGSEDLHGLASNVVKAQYGDISDSDTNALVGIIAGQAASSLAADIAGLEGMNIGLQKEMAQADQAKAEQQLSAMKDSLNNLMNMIKGMNDLQSDATDAMNDIP